MILIINVFLPIITFSQHYTKPLIKFKHYSVDDGLSQSSVNYIFQDKKGFIWLATQDGLNRFDGYNFKINQHNPLDTTSILANWIFGIDEDDFGYIWLATQKGVTRLDPKTDKFKHYYITNQKTNNLEEVYRILVGNDGFIWYITATTLYKLDTLSGKVTHFEHEIDYFVSNKSDKGFPMFDDGEGIWLGSGSGLFYFIKKLEVFKSYKHNPEKQNSISDNYITGITSDNKGNIWISTKNGLNKFEKKTDKFINYYTNEKSPRNGPLVNYINDVLFSKKGYIWLATYGGGLSIFDPVNNVFYHYTKNETENNIHSNYLLSLYEDRSLNLWIGLDAEGLDIADLKPQKFSNLRSSSQKNGFFLSSNTIGSIYAENDSILWIGTWENGLNIVNRNTLTTKIITTNTSPDKIVGNNVHSIFPDSKGLIWICTRSGISIYDKKTKSFSSIDDYFKIDINNRFKDLRIYDIKEDFKGNIWISTKNGLFRFNYQSKTINLFTANFEDSLSLYDNTVLLTICDKDGFIWIGTKSGLNRYDYNTNKFYRISNNRISVNDNKRYTAPSNPYIYHIAEDLFDENILWIGTGSGLNKFNKKH